MVPNSEPEDRLKIKAQKADDNAMMLRKTIAKKLIAEADLGSGKKEQLSEKLKE